MSAETKKAIVYDRIRTSDEKSPIAVFRTERPDFFRATFANTVLTQRSIAVDAAYVGTYHGEDGVFDFMSDARKGVKV